MVNSLVLIFVPRQMIRPVRHVTLATPFLLVAAVPTKCVKLKCHFQVVYITLFYSIFTDCCKVIVTIVSRPMMLMGGSRKRFEALSGLAEICGG
jgi:hypothetical protein